MTPLRFSRRTEWTRRANPWTGLRQAKESRGEPLLDLVVSNPTQVGLEYPDELREALADRRGALYRPDPLGLPEARQAVAACLDGAVVPGRVMLTASTSEAYAFLFKLLADAGDAVLVPRPGYPLFEFLGGLESLRTVDYLLDPDDGWSLNRHALEAAATDDTRAVVVVNPGNPDGVYLKQDEWAWLQQLCSRRGWAVISDEVFSPYAHEPDPRRVACAAASAEVLTFSLGGLSKWAGLPQLKLAWTAVGGPQPEVEQALERLEVMADTYLSVATPVQWAAPTLLHAGRQVQDRIRRRVQANRAALQQANEGSCCRTVPAEGGWSAVLHVPAVRSSEEWALELLEKDDLLVHPGYFYDFPREAYLVLSLLPPEDTFREGVRRLVARLGAA
jgi:aspartate/methionine/tyrosine aminotransferase